jgi:hypothetical protein
VYLIGGNYAKRRRFVAPLLHEILHDYPSASINAPPAA